MKIPIFDLKKQYKQIEPEIKEKLKGIFEKQAFILGEEVGILEKKIASYCGGRYAIGVNSGTDALILALDAMGIKAGDEVITTPFSFIATAEAIVRVGARPVFVDIDPETYNINPALIDKKITKNTKAILPVHLYGLCADMDSILKTAIKHNLKVLEDSAQAIGSEYKGKRVGSMGNAGSVSFYPGKNLGCFGDGGMVVTNDEKIYEKVKLLRNHGSGKRYYHKIVGYNSRLDNLQAAILNIKLSYLDKWIEKRIKNAGFFNEALKGYPLITPSIPEDCRHSFHLYTLKTPHAPKIITYLNESGIDARTYYPLPLHLQECFKSLGYKLGDLSESEKCSNECFSIPVYPELTGEEAIYIAEKIKQFFKK